MLARIGSFATRRARLVLAVTLFTLLAAGAFGSSVVSKLSSGGFTDPSSPSTRADAVLAQRFHRGDPNVVFLVEGPHGVDTPETRSVGLRLTRDLSRQANVTAVQSYWSAPPAERAGFVSSNGRDGLVTAVVLGGDNASPKRAGLLVQRFAGREGGITVAAGGLAVINYQINKQITHDLDVAEAVAIPLTFLALVLVFGSVVAALLPLTIGVVAILSTLAILRVLTLFVPVSVYALNLTTALGLGLAIDYSLFIVSRYREELKQGRDGRVAVLAAVSSAGRTVLFSSLTVGLSLAAMLIFPFYFLRSFAYAGLAVVAVAALASVVLLPALLSLLGDRAGAGDVRSVLRRVSRRSGHGPDREMAFWRRTALAVMRHPWGFGLAVVTVLVVLGSPFLSVRFGLPDDRVLPARASSHLVGDVLRTQFSQDSANDLTVVMARLGGVTPPSVGRYASELSMSSGVQRVISPAGTYVGGERRSRLSTPVVDDGTYLVLENGVNPYSAAGEELVRGVREVPAPAPALVTGAAARNQDALRALGGLLPIALGTIALSTLLVLFAFSRSVLLPFKALLMNTLSLSATFGAMVWIFQEGHLGWLVGGPAATGYLNATMPVLMFCIAFGLSMDYEVFLLSRIREAWVASDHTAAANRAAVVEGLESTGRLVTAAAALISIVFVAVATSQVSFIKLFGTGMTVAVLVDATLVRGVLVPAFMRLAGRANWWVPRSLPWRRGAARESLPEAGVASESWIEAQHL